MFGFVTRLHRLVSHHPARTTALFLLFVAGGLQATWAQTGAPGTGISLGITTGTTTFVISLPASADSYILADARDANQAKEAALIVGGNSPGRALVRFSQTDIQNTVGSGSFLSASLELYAGTSAAWKDDSRPVNVHRITENWTESGVTWNCANDSNPSNDVPNCVDAWNGLRGSFAKVATADLLHENKLDEYLRYDVTDDVGGFLVGAATNLGWLVKKRDEDQDNGVVEYSSREGLLAERPRLILEFTNLTPTPTPNPACRATPLADCRQSLQAGRSLLLLKTSPGGSKDKFLWKWQKGEATSVEDFGDPTRLFNGTQYSLCLYDEVASRTSLAWSAIVPAATTCTGDPCWKATGTRGFRYSDRERSTAGLQKLSLKAGSAGKTKIVISGKGSGLQLPSLPLSQDQSVLMQLKNDAGQCWESRFTAPAKRNIGTKFKDTNDAPGALAPTRTRTPTRTPTSATTPVPVATATPTTGGVAPTPTPSATFTVAGPTHTPTPTNPPAPTNTLVPTSTPLPTNTPAGPSLGGGICTLADGSVIRLFTGFLARDLPATGAISVDCGSLQADGTAECSCGVVDFDPVSVPGIGFACISPATAPCASGAVACNGGGNLGVDIRGDHDKTLTCTGNPDCASKCASKCGGSDSVLLSGCEGFCSLGSQQACTLDANCLPNDGACSGKDGVPLGNACECTCVDSNVGPPSGAGGLQCQLAFNLVVEAATANPPNCDGQGDSPLINVGDTCAPLTTENVAALLNNAEGTVGATIPSTGTFTADGVPTTCAALGGGNLSGLQLRGATVFYGSTIGDLVTALLIDCE